MERELKIWGERWLIRKDDTHAVAFLKLITNHRCSWHQHQTKYNLFVVIDGQVLIKVEELGHIRHVLLSSGECFTVKPGQWHEFQVLEPSEVIEEMYVSYNEDDIERKQLGGTL